MEDMRRHCLLLVLELQQLWAVWHESWEQNSDPSVRAISTLSCWAITPALGLRYPIADNPPFHWSHHCPTTGFSRRDKLRVQPTVQDKARYHPPSFTVLSGRITSPPPMAGLPNEEKGDLSFNLSILFWHSLFIAPHDIFQVLCGRENTELRLKGRFLESSNAVLG